MPAKKAATAIAKPTYAVMVVESIKAIGDRTGSSVYAITKQLQSQYHIEINKHALSKALKKGVESGDLLQIKASYKINRKAPVTKPKKPVVVKKKPAPKKETIKKQTTTTSTRKTTAMKPKKTIAKSKTTSKKTSTTSTKKASLKRTATTKKTSTKKKGAGKK